MMIGYGGYQAYPAYGGYGGYGYNPAMMGGGYQMPSYGMDMYAGQMGGMGGDLNSYMANSYAQMNQQLRMAEANYGALRQRQGIVDNNNQANVGGEIDLMKLLRQGVLNREEFVAASATQNEIQRVLAQYKSDGQISPQEHQHLAQMRARLQDQLRQFAAGDCKPEANMDDKSNKQAGALFDLVKAGKLSPNAAQGLRQQMAIAAAQRGAEEGGDPNALNGEKDSEELLEGVDKALEEADDNKVRDRWRLGEQKYDGNPQLHGQQQQQPAYGYGPQPGYGYGYQGNQGY